MSLTITPQAIFSPELPAGWDVKSSGEPWIITVLPITSLTRKRFVRKALQARPLLPKRGGRSPA